MAKKYFVLRTESLVSKEGIGTLLSFDTDNEVDIPFPVIDKLEQLTHQYSQKGKNAKAILDYLSRFTIKNLMSEDGVKQKNGSTLRLVNGYEDVNIPFSDLSLFDKRCLQIAKGLKMDNPKSTVILISKNPALRLKANSIGIKAQNFKDDIFPTLEEQYTGRIECQTSEVKLQNFFEKGTMPIKDIYNNVGIEWMPNLFLQITSPNNTKSALARFDGREIVKLNYTDYHPYGISAKNSGQLMLLESLLEGADKAPLVIIKGGAGTGKTYVSLAAALEKVCKSSDNNYSQILVSTPTETVGQEHIGYLPGDIEDKFNPYLGGLKDNLRILISKSQSKADQRKDVNNYFNSGKIQVQPIGFLRGRTIVNTFFIIDETQNISPDDIKSIVSRAGMGSKFVFLGDPTQIDNPQLNERYNGLVYLSEKMKDNPLAWQVTLKDSESVRSDLARIAAKIL